MRSISVSKIEKALLCALSMKFQYVDKIPQPSSWKLIAGNVIHEILEYALRELVKTGTYPDWKTLDDMYEPVWERRQKEEEEKSWFIGWQSDKDDPVEDIRREYRPLIRVARAEVLPTVRPWMMGQEPIIEYQVDLELKTDFGPVNLLGYIDLLDTTGVLMDWKTTDDEVSARAQRTWLQFAGYSLFTYPIVGNEIQECEKIFLVRRKEGPLVQRVPFRVGRKHREWFVSVANQVWRAIKTNTFIPNTEGWYCKPDYCPFYAGCQGEIAGEKAVKEKDPEAEAKARKKAAGPDLYDALDTVVRRGFIFDPVLDGQAKRALAKAEGK